MSVKTIAEIEKIRENTLNEIGARFGMTDFAGARIHIMTCGGAGGKAARKIPGTCRA